MLILIFELKKYEGSIVGGSNVAKLRLKRGELSSNWSEHMPVGGYSGGGLNQLLVLH